MSYSLNEIEALSKRAGRGAGLSWGIAEEAARAVRWLASHKLPSVSLLASVLDQFEQISFENCAPTSLDGIWGAASGSLCPLATGAALNDCADRLATGQPIEMTNVSHPLLVVPFAAWASIHIASPVTISWSSVSVTTDGYGIQVSDPKSELDATSAATLTCSGAEITERKFDLPALRGEFPQSAWARLGVLAHRTYAPATEQSRVLGAGAGVTDND
jgi:hypothetical protein